MVAGEPLTETQQKWLHILSTVFSFVSFAASITVMQIVRNSKLKKGRLSTYDRLLFGISACDLVNSIFTATDSYFEPRDNEYRMVWAFGNDATCNVAGFFGVFYITTWLYHAAISLYYVLLIRFGFRDDNIGWKFELSLHLVAILWPTCSGIAVLALNGFGPAWTSYGCFISNWPPGCVEVTPEKPLEEGEVECDGSLVSWTMIPPTITAFAIILLSNLVIYCHVRSTILKTTRNSVLQFDNKISDPTSPSQPLSRRQSQSAVISTGQLERIRAVRNQSLLYFLVTLATYLPVGVQKNLSLGISSLDRETESIIYPIIVFRAILTPISGFFNLIIFCRPTYLRYRRNFPEVSRIEAFRRTIEAGTGRGGGNERRGRVRGRSQQNGWWGRLLKRAAPGRQENAAPAVASAIVAQKDRKRNSEEGKRENKKNSNVTTHHNADVEKEKDLSGIARVPEQDGDIQLSIDAGSYVREGAFPSNTSINFVMNDDGSSSDQKASGDEDEEVASTGVYGLPTVLSGASSHNEVSRLSHASQGDEGLHRSTRQTNNRPTIEFDSSCIGSISTTSTVEA